MYETGIPERVSRCTLCKRPLLVDGCTNPFCNNHYKRRIREKMGNVQAGSVFNTG